MSELSLFRSATSIETALRPDADVIMMSGDVSECVAQIPDRSIALIVTSSPYNLGKAYEDRVSIEAYLQTQEELITQLCRVLRDDGSICWQVVLCQA